MNTMENTCIPSTSEELSNQIATINRKIEQSFTVKHNLSEFTGWDWGSYHVEKHEKDIIIEAMQLLEDTLKQRKQTLLKEANNDDSAVCE